MLMLTAVFVVGLFAAPVLAWDAMLIRQRPVHADRLRTFRQIVTWRGVVMGVTIVGLAVAATNAAHQQGGYAVLVTWPWRSHWPPWPPRLSE